MRQSPSWLGRAAALFALAWMADGFLASPGLPRGFSRSTSLVPGVPSFGGAGKVLLSPRMTSSEDDDKSRRSVAVKSSGKAEEVANLAIRSMFDSPLYVGSEELHLGLPLPDKKTYPEWFPEALRMPDSLYKMAEKGVEEGWVRRAPAGAKFEIKYGLLRSVVNPAQCAAGDEAKQKELQNEAARNLRNIGSQERYRRASFG